MEAGSRPELHHVTRDDGISDGGSGSAGGPAGAEQEGFEDEKLFRGKHEGSDAATAPAAHQERQYNRNEGN